MVCAIWPSFTNLHNGIPSSGTNTRDFLSFFIFWLISLPAIWFPVHQIRHLFTVKAFVVPTAGMTFFIWALVRANGIGSIVHQPNTSHGSKLAWAMATGIMSSIANFATLIVVSLGCLFTPRTSLTVSRTFLTFPVSHASQVMRSGLNFLQSLLDSPLPPSSASWYHLHQP